MKTVLPPYEDHVAAIDEPYRETIPYVISQHAERRPAAEAIVTAGRPPLTYGALWTHVRELDIQLRAWGIGHGDRVALVLPSGPELAVALLSVISMTTVTALNPAYGAAEIESYLTALRVNVVIVLAGVETPAVTVARALDLPVITLTPLIERAAGLFTVSGVAHGPARVLRTVVPDDLALLARTSGTTSRPKVVPLTHRNLYERSMASTAKGERTSEDRSLILNPLYYSSGTSSLLSILVVGGSAICPPSSTPEAFFTCLDLCHPTLCSAVPAIYQAVLAQAPAYAEIVARHSLRFMRSGSVALPEQVQANLEHLFRVPIITGYGMTEASSIALSPLPPHLRKPGSVGVVDERYVAIMDDRNILLPTGQTGEIVARGPGVMPGYEDDPEANRQAFVDGWFRTGDAGHLDEDGYLFLTGRFKEMINRGGAKVTPHEVENILLKHPAVHQAAVFALPHATLGEDVGAAVVLRPGAEVTERDLRLFVGEQVSAYKVPRRVVFLAELPLTGAGKVQRVGLAARLGLDAVPVVAYVKPRDALEENLAAAWARALGVALVGIHDNFFDLGGNSLLAAQACVAMEDAVGQVLPTAILLEAPTIAQLVTLLGQTEGPFVLPMLVPLQTLGTRPPLFCVPYVGGPALGYRELARMLGPMQPVYGLQETGAECLDGGERSVSTIAASYVAAIRAFQPDGPYYLAGSSSGGVVAYEMAQQLEAQGAQIGLVVLCDSICPGSRRDPSPRERFQGRVQFQLRMLTARVRFHATVWTTMRPEERPAYLRQRLVTVCRKILPGFCASDVASQSPAEPRMVVHSGVMKNYALRPYAGPITLFWSSDNPLGQLGAADPRLGWRRVAQRGLEVLYFPGNHSDFIYHADYLRQTVVELHACLRRARRSLEK